MKQSLQASVDGLPLNSSGTALTRLPELITTTGCHRRAAAALQKRPRSGSPLRCAKDRRLVYFFYGSRVKQHRADRAGQEVRHRNSIERPVYFQNKTPRGRISTDNKVSECGSEDYFLCLINKTNIFDFRDKKMILLHFFQSWVSRLSACFQDVTVSSGSGGSWW